MRIELNVGLYSTKGHNSAQAIASRQSLADVLVLGIGAIASARTVNEFDLDKEPTVVYALNTTLSQAEIEDALFFMCDRLKQDCIAMYYPDMGQGKLVGPNPTQWGDFNIDSFERA